MDDIDIYTEASASASALTQATLPEKIKELAQVAERSQADIQSLCHDHYGEFLDSVDELVTLHRNAGKIRQQVVSLNDALQASGAQVLAKAQQLQEQRRVLDQVDSAVRLVQGCQSVLALFERASKQMESKKFYHALLTLEQLESVHLRRIAEYSFAEILAKRVPLMRNTIKDAVLADFKQWLGQYKSDAANVGRLAMRDVDNQQKQLAQQRARYREMHSSGGASPLQTPPPAPPPPPPPAVAAPAASPAAAGTGRGTAPAGGLVGRLARPGAALSLGGTAAAPAAAAATASAAAASAAEYDADRGIFEQARVDLVPVYRALHVHETLGVREEFKRYYVENRKMQLSLLLDAFNQSTVATYRQNLEEISGFFLIERAVLETTRRFLSSAELEATWESAMARMSERLSSLLAAQDNATRMLDAKDNVLLLCTTMRQQAFAVHTLLDAVSAVRGRFVALVLSEAAAEARAALEGDQFLELQLANMAEAEAKLAPYGLMPEGKLSFPLRCQFSDSVPQLCRIVGNLIQRLARFMTGLADVGDVISTAVDTLLSRTVNAHLVSVLESGIAAAPAAQIAINCGVLAAQQVYFEGLIAAARVGRAARLTAAELFRATRLRAEDKMFESISDRIREFFSIADNLDWTPNSTESGPREYIHMLVQFLEMTFSILPPLSRSTLTAMYFVTCRQIASLMMEKWRNKVFNMAAVYNLSQDLRFIEDFAASRDVPDLRSTFAELRELVDLLLREDFDRFVEDDAARMREFPHIEPSRAMALLSKYKEMPMLVIVRNVPKHKRKSIDNMIKKLKEQMARQ